MNNRQIVEKELRELSDNGKRFIFVYVSPDRNDNLLVCWRRNPHSPKQWDTVETLRGFFPKTV